MKAQDTNEYIIYSNYMEGNKEAKVVRHRVNDSWGVLMIEGNKPGFLEYYPTKSESWAEDCAENFVLGIKQL